MSAKDGIKTGIRWVVRGIVLVLALIGLYQVFMYWQYGSVEKKVEAIEAQRDYDPDFKYFLDGGEPLFLVKPENKTTLFFMEGFRTQAPAGMYREW